jgi:tetratricopeptide (TPR) repeat protein
MRILAAALPFVVAASLAAQTPAFVGPRPDLTTITVHRNVEFRAATPEPLKLDLYRPKSDAVVPVVIFANVGNPGMKNFTGYIGWGEAVAGAGLAAVHYDSAWNSGFADFDALLAFLRTRASTYHLDLDRIVVWSGSSNVQLGLPVAMDPRRKEIRGAVVYYGDAEVQKIRLDVPLLYVRAGRDVPALNARIDKLVARAMQDNAPWTLVNVAAGSHGFDAFDTDLVARDTVVRTLEFMKAVTTPEVSTAYAALAEEAANAAAFARGEWDVAIEGYRRRLTTLPSDAEGHRRLGLALTEKKQYAEALISLERAYELGRRGTRDTVVPAAVAAAGAGNVARVIHWLDLALATPHAGTAASYLTDPRFARVREDPAFIAVIAKHTR